MCPKGLFLPRTDLEVTRLRIPAPRSELAPAPRAARVVPDPCIVLAGGAQTQDLHRVEFDVVDDAGGDGAAVTDEFEDLAQTVDVVLLVVYNGEVVSCLPNREDQNVAGLFNLVTTRLFEIVDVPTCGLAHLVFLRECLYPIYYNYWFASRFRGKI